MTKRTFCIISVHRINCKTDTGSTKCDRHLLPETLRRTHRNVSMLSVGVGDVELDVRYPSHHNPRVHAEPRSRRVGNVCCTRSHYTYLRGTSEQLEPMLANLYEYHVLGLVVRMTHCVKVWILRIKHWTLLLVRNVVDYVVRVFPKG